MLNVASSDRNMLIGTMRKLRSYSQFIARGLSIPGEYTS